MADELNIVVKALLDEKDLRARAAAIEDVTIHGKIVIDKADLKKQIDGIAGESSKFGNKFKIKYGVDKGDFVKQFRVAGEEAKKEVEKALSGGGSPVKINVEASAKGIAKVAERMGELGFDDVAVNKATQALKSQQIIVTEISQGYKTVNKDQQEFAQLTIKGVDAAGSLYSITERYNISQKESLDAIVNINSKLNEQGDIVNKMATKMQPKDIGTIKAEESEILKRFVSNLQKANEYTGDMRATADSLGVSLSNAFSKQEIETYRNQLSIAKEQFRALQAEAARVAALPTTKIDTNVSSLNTSLAYQGMDAQTAGITNLRNEINSLIAEYGRLKVSMDSLDPNSAEFQALGVQVDSLDTRFKSATKAAELFNGSFSNKTKLAGIDDQIRKAKSSLEELESKWSKFKGNPALLTEFKELQAAAQQLDATNLQNFNKQLASFKTNVRAAGADTRKFGDELKNALAKFGLWITASSIFMQAWRGMRQMVDSVKELDAALVEFNKVADLSSSQLDKFIDRAFEAGEALGRTGTEVIQATAIFKQAGYSVEESLNLANSALVMKNVSENIESTAAAASDLIAVMKGFDLAVSDSLAVVDMINNVSNNLPIAFGSVSEGLTRISGTLAQTGTSIQETIGLITGGFASLRNVEKVSSGLIILNQRLRGISESGDEIEGLAPKLQSAFKEIAGIDIADANGELRSTYDIIADLAKVADTLGSKERQYLFELAAGNRQVSVLNAIVNSWDSVTLAIDKATNSTGSAMRENDKFLDSIQGKTNRLASSFQMLASNTIESGAIKGLIDFANALVQVIDKIGPLQTALLAITGFTTLFSNGKLAGTVASLGKSFLNMGKTFLMLPKTIKQSNENFIGPLQAGASTISSFRLAVLGVTAAFTVAKVALDSYDNSLAEHTKRAQDAISKWSDTSDALADTKQAIETIGPEFEKLSSGVDTYGNNISLTSEQFDRYNQIANQVAAMFPEMVVGYTDQGTAILSTAGYVSELTDAYEKQELAARRASAASANVVFEAFKRRTSTGDFLGRGEVPLESERDVINAIINAASSSDSRVVTLKDIVSEMGRAGASASYSNDAFKGVVEGAGLQTLSPGSNDFDAKWIKEHIGLAFAYRDALNSQLESETNAAKPFIESIMFGTKKYQGLSDDAKQAVSNIVSELGYEYYSQFSSERDASAGLGRDILMPLEGDSSLLSGISIIEEATANFKDGKKSVGEYTTAWAEFQSLISNSNLKPAVAEAITSTYDIGNIEPLIANVKKKLPAELSGMVSELSNKQLQIAGKMEIDPATIGSWQQFLDLINQASAVMSSLTIGERLAAIASAASVANSAFSEQGYSAAVTKEQYDELAKAGEEYVGVIDNTNGYLSINKQKLDALILSKRNEEKANIAIAKAAKLAEFDKNAKEIQSLSDQVNLLGDAYDDTKQSLLDKNAALIDNQSAILEEVKNLDLQASALEYATSAYKRWLDAKNAPEAGDMYDELPNAWKAIDEGLKTGKIGTEKYLSAVELLIPESVNKNDEKAIANYKKSVMEYFAEDGSGLNKFTNGLLAGGFMEQLADGSYVGTAKANIESIASSLDLTEGTVEALFLALKDYGWNVELNDGAYETTAAAQELAKATDDLATAQDKLDKAKLSGASAEEIKTLEKSVDSAQEKVDKLSATEIEPEMSTGEKLLSEIEKLQTDVDKLLINIPATLNPDLNADLLAIQTSLDTDANLIAKARIDGDPQLLNDKLAELTSKNNPDGTPKTPIQLSIDAQRTAAYNAAILEIEKLQTTPPSTALGVTIDPDDVKGAGDTLDGIAAKPRNAVITVDTQELSDAEKWLAEFQAKMDKLDPEGKEQSLAGSHSGTGYQSTPEEIQAMWASQETPKSPSRVDPDQDEVHLLDTLNEAEKKANEIRQTVKESTLASIKTEQPNFQEIDRWAEHLQGVVSDLETKKESLNQNGIQLSPEDSGKLDAYKETLDGLVSPKTITLDADGSQVVSKTDTLVKDIEGRNPTLKVDVEYGGRGGVLPGFAKGTKKAKKGVALTGEQGVETVITKDGFYTVGHDGPELVNLRGGEEILNDKDTKKLFKGSKGKVSGQAFENGSPGLFTKILSNASTLVKKAKDYVEATNKKAATTVVVSGDNPLNGEDGRGGKGGKKPKKVAQEDLQDWIPILIENVRKETEKIVANAEKQVAYQEQNSQIDKAIDNNTRLMNLNSQAFDKYMQQANQVGLSADLISKVQNGAIDISAYDEDTRKLISAYQKWYELAEKTKDSIVSIGEEQRKLATTKLDNVQKYYENRIGAYGNSIDIATSTLNLGRATGREVKREDYDGMIGDINAQLDLLQKEKLDYERTFTELVRSGVIKEGSNDWYQYTAKINDMQKSILQASLSLDEFNDLADAIAVNNLNVAIKYLNTVQGTLESVQGLREAQGKTLSALDYEQLISVGMQQIEVLEAQNLELLRQQEGLDVLSDGYQEIQDNIDENLNGIWNIKTSQEGWNDAILDLSIAELRSANEQYDRQLQTMEAIEALEKSKQRRNLVYRDGKGFGYEADNNEIRAAQKAYDDVLSENLIASLENSEKDNNVYDSAGNLIGKQSTSLDGVDFGKYLSTVIAGNENSGLLSNSLNQINYDALKGNGANTNTVTFSGDIVLNGVDDAQGLAEALKVQLPSYISQLWFSKK